MPVTIVTVQADLDAGGDPVVAVASPRKMVLSPADAIEVAQKMLTAAQVCLRFRSGS